MKKKKMFWGIRTKLSVCFITLLFVSMICLDIAVFQIYKRDIEGKEMASMTDGSEILAENIKNLISGIEENVMNEIKRCNVFGYLSGAYEKSEASINRKLNGFGTLMHFRGLECKSIVISDCEGNRFFCDFQSNGITFDEFKQKSVYHVIEQLGDTVFMTRGSTIWRRYPDFPKEINIIKSYIDPSTLKYCGSVCLNIDRCDFQKLLGTYNFEIIIYDEQENVLYSSVKLQSGWEESGKYLHTNTVIDRRSGMWKLTGLISKKVAFRELSKLMYMLIFIEILVGMVIVFIVYKMSEGFLWNIMALTDNFRRINLSEKVKKIEPHSHDETTFLCEQFESMYQQMQQNAEQMVATNTLLAKAEYNSLESISAMAKLEKQDRIVKVLQKLSYLLRASLSDSRQEITLEKEIEYISCYLEMQRMITGERIIWDIFVEEKLRKCLVPKLILQPIVENSFVHGLDDMLDEAIIIITADLKENKLIITVSDNGKGMEQSAVKKLLSGEKAEQYQKEHVHLGVRSVLKRIQILYGEEYGITMESEPYRGMIVRLFLPDKRSEGKE